MTIEEKRLAGIKRVQRYRMAHPERIKRFRAESGRRYRQKHAQEIKAKNREKYLKNRDKILTKRREYAAKNPEKIKAANKVYRVKTREYMKKYFAEWYEKNRGRVSQKRKAREIKNRRKINDYKTQWAKRRVGESLSFRIMLRVKSRTRNALRGLYKSEGTTKLIGCDTPTLRAHIESQFKDGMSWDNYGLRGWHIDHKKPCALFDLTDPEQQRACFHYTNLQPLWAHENFRKGARWQD